MKCRKTSADYIGKGCYIMSITDNELKVGQVTTEITNGVYTSCKGITITRGVGSMQSAMFFQSDMNHVYEISPTHFDVLRELYRRHSSEGMFNYAFSII